MSHDQQGGNSAPATWSELLVQAVTQPGAIHEAYSRFWNYSTGNQMLALFQCHARGIELGPIATFMHWKELGRSVKKGAKAIELCMPVTCKAKSKSTGSSEQAANTGASSDDSSDSKPATFTRFIYRRNWFVLAQTEGEAYTPEPLPGWDEAKALEVLKIERIAFGVANGNCQGFAKERSIAVSPIAALPHKTLFHELAHVQLGHTAEGQMNDGEVTPKTIREAEAESVALICLESLGLPGAEHCRGYIQHWLAGGTIDERSAQRIFKAADSILKAGR